MKLTEKELNKKLPDNWRIIDNQLERLFKFEDFQQALDFVNKVGALAEKADHHPDIIINYNKVTLKLSTHSESGITEKDIKLANQINKL